MPTETVIGRIRGSTEKDEITPAGAGKKAPAAGETRQEEGLHMAEIFRVYKQKNFTVMSNHHLQNMKLSLKAVGLLSKLLSLPDDWNISIRGMAAICRDGYDSIRTAFKELIQEGYVIRRQMRDSLGKLSGVEYIIRESPDVRIPEEFMAARETEEPEEPEEPEEEPSLDEAEKEEGKEEEMEKSLENGGFDPHGENPIAVNDPAWEPYMENPCTENPSTGKPATENPAQQNTNITKYTKILNTKKQNNNIYITPPPPRDPGEKSGEAEEKIKQRVEYQALLADNDKVNLDAVVKLLVRYESGLGQYAYIDGKKIAAEEIKKQFQKLGHEEIERVLCSIANTEIKNIHNYLISALYRTVQRSSGEKTKVPRARTNRFNSFHQREYDYEELERQLLNR